MTRIGLFFFPTTSQSTFQIAFSGHCYGEHSWRNFAAPGICADAASNAERPPIVYPHKLVTQINSNREELRSKKPHRLCIPGTPWQLSCKPALALMWIIFQEQMCNALVPAIPQTLA